MRAVRRFHAATLLSDGRVLVSGGGGPWWRSAEIYDPVTNQWSEVAPMSVARAGHSATLLPDGRVLVAGGDASNLRSTEIYDPTRNNWTPGPDMAVPRQFHLAVTLPNGDVALAGALETEPGSLPHPNASVVVEAFSPATGRWYALPSLTFPRRDPKGGFVAGHLVVVGGVHGPAETLIGQRWTPSSLGAGREETQAIVTPEGNLLVVGGNTYLDIQTVPDEGPSTAEMLDAQEGRWTPVAPPHWPRTYGHRLALTGTGDILMVGGPGGAELFGCPAPANSSRPASGE